MPKTYHMLDNGQMIIMFSDLLKDDSFLERSLALYRKEYMACYPDTELSDDDFTMTLNSMGESYIKYPSNVVFVNFGCLTDIAPSNSVSQERFNSNLIEVFNNTHQENGERMISIIFDVDSVSNLSATELYYASGVANAIHCAKQDQLRKITEARFDVLSNQYVASAMGLKVELKKMLKWKLSMLSVEEKIAFNLIDIQNDFVLEGFALYVARGENTIISNMALLDALAEILKEEENWACKVDIITSQDAHVLFRTIDHPDAKLMATAYGFEATQAAVNEEQRELMAFNPANHQYGLHCISGTVGAAIAKPIEDRLANLKNLGVAVHRFAKINFSGPAAGMKLKDGVDLGNLRYQTESIYDEHAQSYLQFFADKQYQEVFATGICANVCVQLAAEGLAEAGHQVTVIDSCVHYLVTSNLDAVKNAVLQSYRHKGVTNLSIDSYPSNPENLDLDQVSIDFEELDNKFYHAEAKGLISNFFSSTEVDETQQQDFSCLKSLCSI